MVVPICFVLIFITLIGYFSTKGFYAAAASFVLIKLLANCFMITALTTKLNAYRANFRDHIRFLLLVVVIPLGRSGVYFITNNPELVYKTIMFFSLICFFLSLRFRKVLVQYKKIHAKS